MSKGEKIMLKDIYKLMNEKIAVKKIEPFING